jgi:hypothetical protein
MIIPKKQFIALLALGAVSAAPFVANEWIRVVKLHHDYEEQKQNERDEQAAQARQAKAARESAAQEAFINSPVQKQWREFAQAVQSLNDEGVCSKGLLIQLSAAIRAQDFEAFNGLMRQVPAVTADLYFHYADVTDPSLTQSDLAQLSHFIKPPLPDYASNLKARFIRSIDKFNTALASITDVQSARKVYLDVDAVGNMIFLGQYNELAKYQTFTAAQKESIRSAIAERLPKVQELIKTLDIAHPDAAKEIKSITDDTLDKLTYWASHV